MTHHDMVNQWTTLGKAQACYAEKIKCSRHDTTHLTPLTDTMAKAHSARGKHVQYFVLEGQESERDAWMTRMVDLCRRHNTV